MNLKLGSEIIGLIRVAVALIVGNLIAQVTLWIQWMEVFLKTDINLNLDSATVRTNMTLVVIALYYRLAREIEKKWPNSRMLGLTSKPEYKAPSG